MPQTSASVDSRGLLSRLPSQSNNKNGSLVGIKSDKELREALESKHPKYIKMEKIWKMISDLYLGDNVEEYLFQHHREKTENFNKRKTRSYFFNYVQSIVDLIGSFIFSKTITRQWESPEDREAQIRELRNQQIMYDIYQQHSEELQNQQLQERHRKDSLSLDQVPNPPPDPQQADPQSSQTLPPDVIEERVQEILDIQSQGGLPELQEYWKNIDLRGTSVDEFSLMVFISTQVFGHTDVFTDMDALPEGVEIRSEQERKDLNLRPYSFVIFPLDLLNWEIGVDGKFNWIRWREEIVGDVGPWNKRPKKQSFRYYTWTREEYWIHEIRFDNESNQEGFVREMDHKSNPLSEIPLARFYNKKHLIDKMLGVSAMKDIGKINVEIFNICSLLDEEVYSKLFNILVMQGGGQRKGSIEIGSNNVLMWEGEGAEPYYLSPSAEPSQFMMEMIKMCIQEIYRLAKLGGDTGVQEAQSGIAYTWEFNQTNRMLADKADMMERGEMEMHRHWSLWMGKEWNGLVDYPDNFNVEKFEDEVKRVMEVKNVVRSPEFKRIVEKDLASRAMSKKSQIQRARVFAEIDVMDEEKQPFFPQF